MAKAGCKDAAAAVTNTVSEFVLLSIVQGVVLQQGPGEGSQDGAAGGSSVSSHDSSRTGICSQQQVGPGVLLHVVPVFEMLWALVRVARALGLRNKP